MNKDNAKKIISHIVEVTRDRWEEYIYEWDKIDEVFLVRAYEQMGFESWKFFELLSKYGINSIDSLGRILEKMPLNCPKAYDREFAGSLNSPFYKQLRDGAFGLEGKKFYETVKEFLNSCAKKGVKFWNLLWDMLRTCYKRRKEYRASFRFFLLKKYSEFKGSNLSTISDDLFLKMSYKDYASFKKSMRPWDELYGVG